ncbi:MAG: glycosyltransferase family 39 protein [bacterium]|nr:glycosyltransferase family 39 protein [bacterium]
MKSSSWPFFGGVIALWIVIAVLILAIPDLYMHSDEELSYRATNGSVIETLRWQTALQDNQAPLWFVMFNLWRGAVGDHEFTARMLGILLAALALAVTYRVVAAMTSSARAALFSLAALTGNHYLYTFALDIRPYPLAMLAAACSTWAFARWLRRSRPRDAVLYGVSLAFMLYTHYLLIFLAAAHGFYLIVAQRRLTAQRIRQGLQAGIVALALWGIWLPTFFAHVIHLRNLEAESGTGRGIAGIGVSTQATTPDTITRLIDAATNGLPFVYALILFYGVTQIVRPGKQRRNERQTFALLLTWGLLTPCLYLTANLIAAVYAPRYVSHAVIGLGAAVGLALWRLPKVRGVPLAWLGLCALITLHLFTFPGRAEIPRREPYRMVYDAMNAAAQPGDVVYFHQAGEDDPLVAFNVRQHLEPQLASAITTDMQTAQAARRVWFVTRAWFAPGVQDAFERLERTHPLQTVIGRCDLEWCILAQLMQAAPLDAPYLFGEVLPFYGADVDQVGRAHIDVRLWWRVDQPIPLDYSMGLQVLDSSGTLVAQHDGPIHDYGVIVQTSGMNSGQIYIDRRRIALNPPLEAGDYRLVLVVYQPWDGQRLLLPNRSDHLLLENFRLS